MQKGRKGSLKLEGVVGLDIGSSQVKLIQLRRHSKGYKVTAAGVADIATGEAYSDRKEMDTAEAIRNCLESAGTQATMAVCGVSGPEVAVRYFKFPSLLPQEIEGAVLLEAAQVCPFNVEEGAVDYQLISDADHSENVCGVLVAATNEVITKKKRLAEDASLNCLLMDIDGLALLNCFEALDSRESEKDGAGRTTAILNIGNCYTTLAIVRGNGLPFIRDIDYAGKDILGQIARENNISTDAVWNILSGGEKQPGCEVELVDSLGRACRKLIVDVAETLRYYTAQEKSAIVDQILVCGGLALVKGLVELLDKELPARAVLWNPFDKMGCGAGEACEEICAKKGPAMVVAAGLAMRSI